MIGFNNNGGSKSRDSNDGMVRSSHCGGLAIPRDLHIELDEKERLEDYKEMGAPQPEHEPQQVPKVELRLPTIKASDRFIEVFSMDEVASQELITSSMSHETRTRRKGCFEAVKRHCGIRKMPDFKGIGKKLDSLLVAFGNFAEVIEHYRHELALAGRINPKEFRVQPILLDGDPGVGKTAFVQALSGLMELPFKKFSAGGLQSASTFVGGSAFWANSQHGLIFETLAFGEWGSNVLLIDEVEKISSGTQYPIVPALLELLESESAKRFKDESLNIQFDASKLIILMTSNDKSKLDSALLSRCKVFDIGAPTPVQRLLIAKGEHEKVNAAISNPRHRTTMDEATLNDLANSKVNVRQLVAAVRKGCAIAASSGNKVVTPVLDREPNEPRGVGFLAKI